jgi:hypothetical protein
VIIYCAGNVPTKGGDQDEQLYREAGLRHRLLSYAERKPLKDTFEYWLGPLADKRLFMDSGAFGAHTRGVRIPLDEYCAFCLENRDNMTVYAALDVIKDWQGTARNLDLMRAKGLDPLPTFHRGSPFTELQRLLAEHEYIALGGVVSDKSGPEDLRVWFDQAWRVIAPYWPRRVHAFGVTAQWALERYPFHSADSSAALVGAGMGRVMQFAGGVVRGVPWLQHVRQTMDGSLADGVCGDGSAYARRRAWNSLTVRDYERYITDVWALRGISWDADGYYTGRVW